MLRHFASAVPAALFVGAAHADTSGNFGPGGYYGHPMMWGEGPGFLGAGMMLIFWIIIIAFAVLAGRWLWERGDGQRKTPALNILKERLAKGEIDPEEYEARRKALES